MKQKIHIIAPYPFGQAPSQRFRFEQYINHLELNDYEVVFHPFLTTKTWVNLYKKGFFFQKTIGILGSFFKRFLLLFKLVNAKHIFIHREATHLGPPVFEWILAKVMRKKYIYDFDDAIWLPNYSASNVTFHRLKAYWKVKYCIKWAHKVSAGNAYLAEYAGKFNSNVTIIPTTIDTDKHHNKTINYNKDRLSIGWTGTHTTMHYLNFIVPILKQLELKYDFDFIVISNQKPEWNLKSLQFIKWKKDTEIEDLLKIGIGIMPLVKDQWSVGKCGFKALQYMALGIPSVLSPIGVNKTIVSHNKNGFLAESTEEWEDCLTMLLSSVKLREEMGQKGKETIHNHYAVKSNIQKYLSLFE